MALRTTFVLLALLTSPQGSAFVPSGSYALQKATQRHVPSTLVELASINGNGSSGDNMSAAARARRDEERRRMERRDDVVVGKTSAKPGAKDYSIDVAQTELQWKMQATGLEREINMQTDRGMQALKMIELEEADEAFERVYQLKPDTYLWQAGVVKFYLGDLSGAADCFASNAAIFERRFMAPATEERIWRDACELKIKNEINRKDRKISDSGSDLKDAPPTNVLDESASRETRKVLRIARDLFKGSVENDHSAVALCRAKLRSICGLHYDALGDFEESKACMKMAIRQCASSGNGDDIMTVLPMIHMTKRDWYDDDDFIPDHAPTTLSSSFDTDSSESPVYKWSSRGQKESESSNARSVVKVTIMESLKKMRLSDLKATLKKRQLKSSGSKAELQQRLLDSLLSDAGF